MGIPFYLAMTGAELKSCPEPPQKTAYMACHFSVYSNGLTNLPEALPEDAMLILNDRIPMAGHDSGRIIRELSEQIASLKASCLLLDFQIPGSRELADLAERIVRETSAPVGITPQYWTAGAALFLPPIPPSKTAQVYLTPYQGKELWLDTALQCQEIAVTAQGSVFAPLVPAREAGGIPENGLCCYSIRQEENGFLFRLFDTEQTLIEKLEVSQSLGVTKALGLYQELQKPLC